MKNITICTLSIFSFVLTTSAQSKFKSQRDSLEFEAADLQANASPEAPSLLRCLSRSSSSCFSRALQSIPSHFWAASKHASHTFASLNLIVSFLESCVRVSELSRPEPCNAARSKATDGNRHPLDDRTLVCRNSAHEFGLWFEITQREQKVTCCGSPWKATISSCSRYPVGALSHGCVGGRARLVRLVRRLVSHASWE